MKYLVFLCLIATTSASICLGELSCLREINNAIDKLNEVTKALNKNVDTEIAKKRCLTCQDIWPYGRNGVPKTFGFTVNCTENFMESGLCICFVEQNPVPVVPEYKDKPFNLTSTCCLSVKDYSDENCDSIQN